MREDEDMANKTDKLDDFQKQGLMKLAMGMGMMVLIWGVLWAGDKLQHYGHQEDARGNLLPEAPGAGTPGTLGVDDLLQAEWRSKGNDLAPAEAAGRPVAVNATLSSVRRDTDAEDVVVTLDVRNRFKSTIGTSLTPSTTAVCRFPPAAGTAPLSGWMVGQEVAVAAVIGNSPGQLEQCRLSAYVDGRGEPAGNGNIGEAIGGRVRRLDPGQVYPR